MLFRSEDKPLFNGKDLTGWKGQPEFWSVKDGAKPEVKGEIGKSDEIQAGIKPGGWNEYRIVAKGGHLQHYINGDQTVDVTDESTVGAKTGVLALQLHAGAPMTVQFKELMLKTAAK